VSVEPSELVIDLRARTVVPVQWRRLVLPEEFVAYVEILRCVDPEAHASLTRELAAAEEGPAAVETAAHARRAHMLASLEEALGQARADDAKPPRPGTSAG
jgi:hypothetical protein